MARWEPNARERLQDAALELFQEKGYEATTAAEIAERAGLGKSTFFRHFADKREVLFGGQDELYAIFAEAIAGAPASATPTEAVGGALDALNRIFDDERRRWARWRQAVIRSSSVLVERELLKSAALTDVMTEALRKRGVPDPVAALGAEVGNLAFRTAFLRWIDADERRDLASLARAELAALRTALPDL